MIKIYKKETEPWKGSWVVETDTHIADGLAWDEMMGLVARLTMSNVTSHMNWFKKKEVNNE